MAAAMPLEALPSALGTTGVSFAEQGLYQGYPRAVKTSANSLYVNSPCLALHSPCICPGYQYVDDGIGSTMTDLEAVHLVHI